MVGRGRYNTIRLGPLKPHILINLIHSTNKDVMPLLPYQLLQIYYLLLLRWFWQNAKLLENLFVDVIVLFDSHSNGSLFAAHPIRVIVNAIFIACLASWQNKCLVAILYIYMCSNFSFVSASQYLTSSWPRAVGVITPEFLPVSCLSWRPHYMRHLVVVININYFTVRPRHYFVFWLPLRQIVRNRTLYLRDFRALSLANSLCWFFVNTQQLSYCHMETWWREVKKTQQGSGMCILSVHLIYPFNSSS